MCLMHLSTQPNRHYEVMHLCRIKQSLSKHEIEQSDTTLKIEICTTQTCGFSAKSADEMIRVLSLLLSQGTVIHAHEVNSKGISVKPYEKLHTHTHST